METSNHPISPTASKHARGQAYAQTRTQDAAVLSPSDQQMVSFWSASIFSTNGAWEIPLRMPKRGSPFWPSRISNTYKPALDSFRP